LGFSGTVTYFREIFGLSVQQFDTATFGKTRFSTLGGIESGEFLMKKG
jgi:hypothetical protein